MRRLTIDGVVFVAEEDIAKPSGPIKIVVIERGFVYVGRVSTLDAGTLQIEAARSLIRWGSSQHLGELVNGPLENTKLGAACTVLVRNSQVIHMIEANQDGWSKHCN